MSQATITRSGKLHTKVEKLITTMNHRATTAIKTKMDKLEKQKSTLNEPLVTPRKLTAKEIATGKRRLARANGTINGLTKKVATELVMHEDAARKQMDKLFSCDADELSRNLESSGQKPLTIREQEMQKVTIYIRDTGRSCK